MRTAQISSFMPPFVFLQRLYWRGRNQVSVLCFAQAGSNRCKTYWGIFLVGPLCLSTESREHQAAESEILGPVPWYSSSSLLGWAGPWQHSPSPGTPPAASALAGNASQKACGIPDLASPMLFPNNQLSRRISILRTIWADNGSDG